MNNEFKKNQHFSKVSGWYATLYMHNNVKIQQKHAWSLCNN